MANLTGLHLSGTPLAGENIKTIGGLSHLKSLSLDWTGLTDEMVGAFPRMPFVVDVSVEGTPIGNNAVRRLLASCAPSVIILKISSTQVTDAVMDAVCQQKKLECLECDHNRIGNAGLARLANLEGLEIVSLRGTDISDEGLQALARMRNLARLDARQTQVTSKGQLMLEGKIPGLRIRIGNFRRERRPEPDEWH
jgi:hypothetical protein